MTAITSALLAVSLAALATAPCALGGGRALMQALPASQTGTAARAAGNASLVPVLPPGQGTCAVPFILGGIAANSTRLVSPGTTLCTSGTTGILPSSTLLAEGYVYNLLADMPYSRSILVSTCTSRLLNGSVASNTSAYLEVFNSDDICNEDEGEPSDDAIAEQVDFDGCFASCEAVDKALDGNTAALDAAYALAEAGCTGSSPAVVFTADPGKSYYLLLLGDPCGMAPLNITTL